MNQATTLNPARRRAGLPSDWEAAAAFAGMMLRATLRDWRTLGILLFTPAIMLVVFRVTGSDDGFDLLAFVFPAIVAMSVFFAGAPFAVRIVGWREQDVFRRLACTPAPLGRVVAAYGVTFVLIALLQSGVILLAGRFLFGIAGSASGAAWAILPLLLGAVIFVAYGGLLAGWVRKAETLNLLYIFTLFPMMFGGEVFVPAGNAPGLWQTAASWLPPALMLRLLRPLLQEGQWPDDALLLLAALTAYALLLTLLAARRMAGLARHEPHAR